MSDCNCFCHRSYDECYRDCCGEHEKYENKERESMVEYVEKQLKKEKRDADELKQLRKDNAELKAQLAKVGHPTNRTTVAFESERNEK